MEQSDKLDAFDLWLFGWVAEEGSLTAAAERLGLPKSTVSRRLAEFEARLGERLLVRTTRKLTLTDLGRQMLAHGRQVVAEVADARLLVQNRQATPSGRLRVSMPADFANLVLPEMLARFAADHPLVTLSLDVSPRIVDIIGEDFDMAIRMGALPDDATLSARQLALLRGGLYAAPAYLRKHGEPRTPEALQQHHALHLATRDGSRGIWRLTRDKETWSGTPPGNVQVNSPELLLRMALGGAGIAAVDDYMAAPHVARGELRRVLPKWAMPPVPAWMVFPGRKLMPSRTRAFVDALCEAVAERRQQL
ncbi:MAG TPA: LysR family transcriptional regulator [Noviherbaspirillum sp.]|jgi:DNA-binding transcriptional LysR family regulator|uniref:LysR family transcriptional regulator n=1 Tax=Noviherbaspirillum sp. TaxID=1926288 RepID=UPI002F932F21